MPAPKRDSLKMICRGINLAADLDDMPPGDFPYLQNTRVLQTGVVEGRPGQTSFSTGVIGSFSPVHSLYELNDYTGQNKVFAAVSTNLYAADVTGAGAGNFSLVDSGFNGQPITAVPFRPDQSTHSFLYCATSTKMQKYNIDLGNFVEKSNIGIVPPTIPPFTLLGPIEYQSISDFNEPPWGHFGNAGAVTQSQRISTTVTNILNVPDGWLISPATTDNSWLAVGARVYVAGEPLTAQEVHPAMGSTTVVGVKYWNVFNACDVVIDQPLQGIARNSLLTIGSALVSVDAIIPSPDGTYCIRIASMPTPSIAIGQTVTSLCTFLVQTPNAHVVGDTVIVYQMQTTLTGAGTGGMATNQISNLSVIQNRPTQPDDYIHISIFVTEAVKVTSGLIAIDIDDHTFQKNYYQAGIRPSDLQGSITGPVLSAASESITNALIQQGVPNYSTGDPFSTGAVESSQLGTMGVVGAWSEILIRVGDLQRIGTDYTKTLANVGALKIELTVTGDCILQVGSWWLGGGWGPDVVPGAPEGIFYRSRYRSEMTGAKSVPSATTPYALFPHRQKVSMSLPGSSDPQVTAIDIERLDPSLQDTTGTPHWAYVGTAKNTSGGSTTFDDILSPSTISVNPPLETNVFQPFPTLQAPVTGLCDVCGTIVVVHGGMELIPGDLIEGTVIIINGTAYQIAGYSRNALFTNFLILTQSAGFHLNTAYSIASPVVAGRPLPIIFGPLGGSTGLFSFALGDVNNPGRLYWFNGNDMDAASDQNFLDITDPSEPLISGIVWENYVFVGSQQRLFLIEPSFGSTNAFTARQIPAASGFISPYAIDSGIDAIYYCGLDGMYKATPWYGGENISPELWPLFPHQGQIPTQPTYGGLQPVNLMGRLRVCVTGSDVYLNYVDIAGSFLTLRYSPIPTEKPTFGWTPLKYLSPVLIHREISTASVTIPSVVPFILQATSVGSVLSSTGTTDTGADVMCELWTPAMNHGDSRAQKLYIDCITDLVGSATVTLLGNYFEDNIVGPVPISAVNRSEQRTNLDLSGNLALFVNLGAQYTFPATTKLYEFQPSYYPQPILSTNLVTQFLDLGMPGWKIGRYGRFELIGSAPVTLKILSSEGTTFTYTLTPGTSLQSIDTQISALCKGRMFSFSLTSDLNSPFVLFAMYFKVKRWGNNQFVEVNPFTDVNPFSEALTSYAQH